MKYKKKYRELSKDFCREIDLKDSPFIDFSMYKNFPIWTGDKVLKEKISGKGFYNFYDPFFSKTKFLENFKKDSKQILTGEGFVKDRRFDGDELIIQY